MRLALRVTLAFAALAVVPAVQLRAAPGTEEAILNDGQRVRGRLELVGGQLHFTQDRPPATLSWSLIERVRLPAADIPPLRFPMVQRLTLPNDQRLTGECLGLDVREVRFRTGWAQQLIVPRHAVLSVTHASGFVPVTTEDFEAGLKAWSLAGAPKLTDRQHTSGQHSLQLNRAGQAAEYVLPAPLEKGRMGINFLESGATTGARWLVEAEFQGAAGPHLVRGLLAGDKESYRAEVPDAPRISERVPRTPGWHRFELEFASDSLIVSIDDAVLLFSRRDGPGGPLRKVRLLCVSLPGQGPARGAVLFDDFSLARAVEKRPHPPTDRTQDELWLLSGDQLFGVVPRSDRRGLDLHGRFGARSFSWGQVRGFFPRQEDSPPQSSEGEHVRVWLRSGYGSGLDPVEGTMQALDPSRLTIQNPLLGELTIDRARLLQLRWLFRGQRIELLHGQHHLGPKGKLLPPLQPAQAEGTSLRRTFRLQAPVQQALLLLQVVHLKGSGDGIGAALERGDLRTEVVLNGKVVDYLNRHVERLGREPRRLVLPLPEEALRPGDNVLELRLTPDHESGRYEHCGVGDLEIDIPR